MGLLKFKTDSIALIMIFLVTAFSSVASGESPEAFMSRDSGGLIRTETFFCHDTIYANIIPRDLKKGSYKASVSWINPKGKEQNYAEQDFNSGDTVRVWFWLKLHPSLGGRFLKAIDPAFGMGDYIGAWRLKLRVNGELRETRTFFVTC